MEYHLITGTGTMKWIIIILTVLFVSCGIFDANEDINQKTIIGNFGELDLIWMQVNGYPTLVFVIPIDENVENCNLSVYIRKPEEYWTIPAWSALNKEILILHEQGLTKDSLYKVNIIVKA